MRVPALGLALLASGLASLPRQATAQQQFPNDTLCVAELRRQGATDMRFPCRQLADSIVTRWRSPALLKATLLDRIPARDLQSRASGEPGQAGAPSQGSALPGTQPIAIGGGSISAVGSESGTDAIAAFTINPSILFGPADKMRAARLSRLLDLSVLVPVSNLDRDEDGKVDYFGARARINVFGPGAGAALDEATDKFVEGVREAGQTAISLARLLGTTHDFAACQTAYMGDTFVADVARAACGTFIDALPNPAAMEEFRAALAKSRDSADAHYFGLDLRLDAGDPTLGATPGAKGTTIFAGLGYGRKLTSVAPGESSYGVKLRLGVQHVALDDPALATGDRSNIALDGAVAFDFTYPTEFRPLVFAAGLDFRSGDPPVEGMEKAFRTNVTNVRLSLDIPVTDANSISIAFAGPVSGKEKPSLSINANWQLLFAALAGRR